MGHKVRVDQVLIDRVRSAFETLGVKYLHNGDGGLTRNELRALEQHGILERMRTASRKWLDTTGSVEYVYRLRRI